MRGRREVRYFLISKPRACGLADWGVEHFQSTGVGPQCRRLGHFQHPSDRHLITSR